jgi:hypothetical protein
MVRPKEMRGSQLIRAGRILPLMKRAATKKEGFSVENPLSTRPLQSGFTASAMEGTLALINLAYFGSRL